MSSNQHLHTGGATAIMYRIAENYISCYFAYHQDDCDEQLPVIVFAYNMHTDHMISAYHYLSWIEDGF